jgi:bis(5'-nucleosidyl)-tetraphosphatase
MEIKHSYGGVIFKKDAGIKFLLVRHSKKSGGHWGFAKGHSEKGESERQTAVREIYEETGLKVKFINRFKEAIKYFDPIRKENKIVTIFLCKTNGSKVNPITKDVDDHVWLDFDKAYKKITYETTKNILKKANIFLKK